MHTYIKFWAYDRKDNLYLTPKFVPQKLSKGRYA